LVSDSDPYSAPTADLTQSPHDKPATRYGCCLASSAGGLLGLVLGGYYGIREYNAAVDEVVQEGLTADFLPVGVPFWALVGAIVGAIVGAVAGSLLLAILRGSNKRLG
jgi:hypothetical protein